MATAVFFDPLHSTFFDEAVGDEERWITVGPAGGKLLILVVHTLDDEDEVSRLISAREVTCMRGELMKVVYERHSAELTKEQLEQLKALEGRPIDLSDIPETTASAWKGAVRGRFYRPMKQAVSLRLDADVLAWLKKDGQGYQTRVNQMLRERMLAELG